MSRGAARIVEAGHDADRVRERGHFPRPESLDEPNTVRSSTSWIRWLQSGLVIRPLRGEIRASLSGRRKAPRILWQKY